MSAGMARTGNCCACRCAAAKEKEEERTEGKVHSAQKFSWWNHVRCTRSTWGGPQAHLAPSAPAEQRGVSCSRAGSLSDGVLSHLLRGESGAELLLPRSLRQCSNSPSQCSWKAAAVAEASAPRGGAPSHDSRSGLVLQSAEHKPQPEGTPLEGRNRAPVAGGRACTTSCLRAGLDVKSSCWRSPRGSSAPARYGEVRNQFQWEGISFRAPVQPEATCEAAAGQRCAARVRDGPPRRHQQHEAKWLF